MACVDDTTRPRRKGIMTHKFQSLQTTYVAGAVARF
jgi:hypothetical protein